MVELRQKSGQMVHFLTAVQEQFAGEVDIEDEISGVDSGPAGDRVRGLGQVGLVEAVEIEVEATAHFASRGDGPHLMSQPPEVDRRDDAESGR